MTVLLKYLLIQVLFYTTQLILATILHLTHPREMSNAALTELPWNQICEMSSLCFSYVWEENNIERFMIFWIAPAYHIQWWWKPDLPIIHKTPAINGLELLWARRKGTLERVQIQIDSAECSDINKSTRNDRLLHVQISAEGMGVVHVSLRNESFYRCICVTMKQRPIAQGTRQLEMRYPWSFTPIQRPDDVHVMMHLSIDKQTAQARKAVQIQPSSHSSICWSNGDKKNE